MLKMGSGRSPDAFQKECLGGGHCRKREVWSCKMKRDSGIKHPLTCLLVSLIFVWPQALAAKDAQRCYDRGTDSLMMNKWTEAITAFTEAVSLKPDYFQAYNNRGLAHFKQNDIVQAVKDFQTAIRLSPHNEKPYNNMAMAYCKQGNYLQALSYLKQALAVSTEKNLCHADLYNNIAFVYMKQGVYEASADAYTRAMRITQNKSGNPPDIVNRENVLCNQIDFDQRIEGHSVFGKFYGE